MTWDSGHGMGLGNKLCKRFYLKNSALEYFMANVAEPQTFYAAPSFGVKIIMLFYILASPAFPALAPASAPTLQYITNQHFWKAQKLT
jgi:hypothetical protein